MPEKTNGECPKCGAPIPADAATALLLLGHGAIEIDAGVWKKTSIRELGVVCPKCGAHLKSRRYRVRGEGYTQMKWQEGWE